jgi:serine/threonine-protein kinase
MHENGETHDLPTAYWVSDRESRLDDVVHRYFKAIDAGCPLDPRELIDQHPDLADELRDFFGQGAGLVDAIVREPAGHSPTLPARVGRCDIHEELGRGGMGTVYRGHDIDLGRDVAIKVLQDWQRDRPELADRFEKEAQICGQLQHPGVVPVYQLSAFPDGRPYFTMKLVKGQTLADLLAARKDPAEDRTHFVGVFAQVCQAVAYAHDRGVIHRDLKSLSVMVGAFGEVQVMDWGLARVLNPDATENQADEAATTIRTDRAAGSDTGSDTFLGTPAYVPPEQARCEIGRLDERCDVFALGSMLCEVLTGKPAYTGRDREEVYCKARDADTADALARLDGCGADPALVELTKRCLAAEPVDRLRNAGEVAAAVTTYQESVAERSRQAELARAAEAARAEEAKATAAQERKAKEAAQARAQAERRKRRAQLGMVAAVLLLVVLGGGAGVWYRQHHLDVVRDTKAALVEATIYRDAGQWAEAKAALERAAGRLGRGGPAELRERVARARADAQVVAAIEEARLRQADVKEGHFDNSGAAPLYAAAFRDYGLDLSKLPVKEAIVRVRDSAVRAYLIAALDDWEGLEMPGKALKKKLRAVADGADDDSWRRAFRDACDRRDREKLKDLVADPQVQKQPTAMLVLLSRTLHRAGIAEEEVKFLQEVQWRHPSDFWLNLNLASALRSLKPARSEEAVGYYRAALVLRPDSPGVRNNLGLALQDTGKVDEAIREYREAISRDPEYATPHLNLGGALWQKGEFDEAIREYREALALDPKSSMAHYGIGNALRDKGEVDEAIKKFRVAIAINPKFALAHNNLGSILCDVKHDYDGAIAHFHKAIAIDPKSAMQYYNLGNALRNKGQLDKAIQEYQKAIAIDPEHAMAHIHVGSILCDVKHDYDGAIAHFHKAIAIDPKHAKFHYNLGNALRGKGQLGDAIEEYKRAIALDPMYAQPHYDLGHILSGKGQLDDAIKEYRAAIAIDPKFAAAHSNLGTALYAKKQFEEAIAEYRAAIDLNPKDAGFRRNLGLALQNTGRFDEAIKEYRAAIAIDPKFAEFHFGLGNSLRDKGKLDEAIEEFRAAINLKTGYAEAYCNLGRVLQRRGDFTAALAALKQGHELGTRQKGWRYPSAQWVNEVKPLADLDRRATELLKGEAKAKNPSELLKLGGFCLTQKKAPVAAARLYADAFKAEPELADDLPAGDRYAAARAAALAGCGSGRDTADLDEPGRARWRKQALEWLRADLKAWAKWLEGADAADRAAVRKALQRWQSDPNLAGLRDAALEKLPEAERATWHAFWADVVALLKRAPEKTR